MTTKSQVAIDPGIVTVLTIDRPEAHNALNYAVLRDIGNALTRAVSQPAVRAIVITGAGNRAFSAGADLDELAGLDTTSAYELLQWGQQLISYVASCPKPVIAAVNGLALGGGFELVLAATFPVLASHARLALPEAGLGLMPGYGGTQRLSRTVGPQVARHMMLTGERMEADRAHALGLTPVEPVSAERSVLTVAMELAGSLVERGPRAMRSILVATEHAAGAASQSGLALENALAGLATGSREAEEGLAAFRDKRPPKFEDAAHTTDWVLP